MILLQIKHNTLYHNYHESILTQDRRLTIESISWTVPSLHPAEDTGWTLAGHVPIMLSWLFIVHPPGLAWLTLIMDPGCWLISVLSPMVGYSHFVLVYTIIMTPNCALSPVLSLIDTFTVDYSLTFLSRQVQAPDQ